MAKRSLDDIFNDDPLGLLNIEVKYKNQHRSNSYLLNAFNDIQTFFERTGRAPQNSESASIEELRLAARLECFRNEQHKSSKLAPYDKYKLLVGHGPDDTNEPPPTSIDDIMDNKLLRMDSIDIFNMQHVTGAGKKQSVNEYTANRKPCKDFEHFQQMFEQVQTDLDNNRREVSPIEKISEIQAGQWFIVQGMIAYVSEMGEKYEHRKGHHNARLRVVFSNKIETNFPTTFRTRETADLFLVLIMQLLKLGGRAAVVLPDGFLFGEGIKTRIKEKLLEECNLHTIVRLPRGVFSPYTDIKTNLLFFTKGAPTRHIWFYEHPYPPGVKSYNKTKPMKIEEFDAESAWWGKEKDGFKKRVENEYAWKLSIGDVKARNYNLDCKNPHIKEQEIHDPGVLLAKYNDIQQDIAKLRLQLKDILNTALAAQPEKKKVKQTTTKTA